MAFQPDTATEIDSYQGNPALAFGSGGSSFSGGLPLGNLFSPQTIAKLEQITDAYVAKKNAQYDQWQKNVAMAYKQAGQTAGVFSGDRSEIEKQQKEHLKFTKDNLNLLTPDAAIKYPDKYAKWIESEQNLLSKIEKSKQNAALDKEYKRLSLKPEFQNDVFQGMYQEWLASPMEERVPFNPISNPATDILKIKKNLTPYKVYGEPELKTLLDVNNQPTGRTAVTDTFTIDEPKLLSDLLEHSEYKRAEYQLKKKKGLIPEGVDEDTWVSQELIGDIPMQGKERPKVTQDIIQGQQFRTATQQDSQDFQDKQRQEREKFQAAQEEKRLRARQNLSSYKNIQPIVENIADFDQNITTVYDVKANKKILGVLGLPDMEIKSISVIDPTNINEKVITKLYTGGKSSHGDAYGNLYKVIENNGNVYYAPAKTVYISEGKNISKEEYNRIQKDGIKKVKESTVKKVVPDLSQKFTKDTLIQNTVTNDKNGSYEYMQWKQANESDLLSEPDIPIEDQYTETADEIRTENKKKRTVRAKSGLTFTVE